MNMLRGPGPINPGTASVDERNKCGRCGERHSGYSLPPPYGGTLDARYVMFLCDRCYSLFIRHCAVFFGIDLPERPW